MLELADQEISQYLRFLEADQGVRSLDLPNMHHLKAVLKLYEAVGRDKQPDLLDLV